VDVAEPAVRLVQGHRAELGQQQEAVGPVLVLPRQAEDAQGREEREEVSSMSDDALREAMRILREQSAKRLEAARRATAAEEAKVAARRAAEKAGK
jgi:hypothetical protein